MSHIHFCAIPSIFFVPTTLPPLSPLGSFDLFPAFKYRKTIGFLPLDGGCVVNQTVFSWFYFIFWSFLPYPYFKLILVVYKVFATISPQGFNSGRVWYFGDYGMLDEHEWTFVLYEWVGNCGWLGFLRTMITASSSPSHFIGGCAPKLQCNAFVFYSYFK